jgi:predicted deacylase
MLKSNIRVIEKQGKEKGKTLVILGGVHGNEVCGVRALDSLIPKLNIERGKVIFIYANLEAIKLNQRFVEQNLNRCFLVPQPKEIQESLEGKTAREIMPYLEGADVMLDVHASFTENSIPFAICDEPNIKEASIFDVGKVVFNIDPFEPGSTGYYMNLQKKFGFGIECGYLGNPKTQVVAENAIINFLISYGAIKGEINYRKEKQEFIKIIDLYRNKNGKFKRARFFQDFELTKTKTLVGWDGEEEVYVDENKLLLFVRDREKMNEECFLVGENIN